MSSYLTWDQKIISDFSSKTVEDLYSNGYVFTRKGKGIMQQTRSIRIDLTKFEISSENRRILKKVDGIDIVESSIPYENYTWIIAKMAKDFYDAKFGPGVMTANKIKEILTDPAHGNFNTLLSYAGYGYAICFRTGSMMHYSYPFYDLVQSPKDMGMGMMVKAVIRAKELGISYVYLGSLQRPGDVYKLQFSGIEWFDGKKWNSDIEEVKKILSAIK
jgi:hypothetical protein